MDRPFRLYLVRHAPAEERGPAWPDDDERPLSREGARKMGRAVRGLRALDVRPGVLVTSPAVRALDTARIIERGLMGAPAVVEASWLAPGATPAAIRAGLRSMSPKAAVVLVGHEPDLGAFAAWLLGARGPVPLKKGGVAAFDLDRWPPKPPARLVWLATPAILRALTRPR